MTLEQHLGPSPIAVPLLSVFPLPLCQGPGAPCNDVTGIDLQIPYEMGVPFIGGGVSPIFIRMMIKKDGAAAETVALSAVTDQIHVLSYDESILGPASLGTGPGIPVVTHADGSPVTPQSPAQPAETVVIYATGIGAGLAQMQDLQIPKPQTGAALSSAMPGPEVAPGFDFRPNASPSESLFSREGPESGYSGPAVQTWAVAGYPGLYQINVAIPQPPSRLLPCGRLVMSNLTIDLSGLSSFDGVGICVALPTAAGNSDPRGRRLRPLH
ncbi:MAG TPA: hypothetical protein VFW83_11200 [Bryobacteraceae bacterium]|nr:hypothetical protein [Bryobacteraceae bacterium]